MIITITLTLSTLVALNFLLLIFSCNKPTRRVSQEKPKLIKSPKPIAETKQLSTNVLAPTGS
ncbi:hypothetical protein [Psychroserpens sp. Hel_I_66]|uniref:hypothetical protein n=1 Tax=Psychroserpens sp. Hel_I_66 TaxID=1250004 RepID=UPI000648D281|nr:hypothetical protein [Psychroserpens sp. Hel_I_66]